MKHNYCIWIVFTLAFSSEACHKQLNVFPTTAAVDGNLITDQKSAQAVLAGVYYKFANVGTGSYGFTGVTSSISPGGRQDDLDQSTLWSDVSEVIPSELSGSSHSFLARDSLSAFTFVVLSGTAHLDVIWKYGYALVNAANGFIQNISPVGNIPAAAKQQLLAEARFLRAFGNSELLLYYGQYNDPSSPYGIILRDGLVNTDNVNSPRSGVAAAYTSILADLDAAIKDLPALNTAIYYANASDAKLLKARVLINRAAAGDYSQVISLTNDIITNGPFTLEDSVKDIFFTKGFDSKEVMLGIQPYPNQVHRFEVYQRLVQFVATDSLKSFLVDDSRLNWITKPRKSSFYGIQNSVTKYFTGDPAHPVPTPLEENGYAFRLTEAYLLEAEAIVLSGGDLASAKSLLTTVMSHAGAGPGELDAVTNASNPATLQLEIVKENLRNFAFENGVDWLALRRLPFATIQSLNPNMTNPAKLILPIPQSELTYNNIIQNPGY